MSHLFYMVNRPLTNGFRPGEQHRADEFAGCDLNWLIDSGSVSGIGTDIPGMPMMVAPPNTDDPNVLKSEIIRLQQQNHMLVTGQGAAAQFFPQQTQPQNSGNAPVANVTRLPSPDNMEDARRLQAAQAAAAEQFRQETIVPVNPVRRNPGQMENASVPTQRTTLPTFNPPVAPVFDHSAIIKRIDETREALIDEIRRYATDGQAEGQDESNVRHKFSDDEIRHLQSDLKAAQDAAADYQRQLSEAHATIAKLSPNVVVNDTAPGNPPKLEPPPAPRQTATRKGPDKPIK